MMKQIETRRSIRKYLDKPIDDKIILDLIESTRLAPSGSNTQPWHFMIIKEESKRKEIAKVSHNQKWMLSAPVFIVCVADIRSRIDNTTDIDIDEESPQNDLKQIIRDTAIATEHIVLEAINYGLGTCWVAWFIQKEIRQVLGLANDKYVVSILPIGYPAEEPKPRNRKGLKEIIHYEKW